MFSFPSTKQRKTFHSKKKKLFNPNNLKPSVDWNNLVCCFNIEISWGISKTYFFYTIKITFNSRLYGAQSEQIFCWFYFWNYRLKVFEVFEEYKWMKFWYKYIDFVSQNFFVSSKKYFFNPIELYNN